jgi:hypothetical protein
LHNDVYNLACESLNKWKKCKLGRDDNFIVNYKEHHLFFDLQFEIPELCQRSLEILAMMTNEIGRTFEHSGKPVNKNL